MVLGGAEVETGMSGHGPEKTKGGCGKLRSQK